MKINILKEDQVFVIDPAGGTSTNCKCGEEALFIFSIHGHYINLCSECVGKVGKTAIDALI